MVRSLFLVYFLSGFLFANWSPRLPDIKHILDLNNQQIGESLLGVSLGAGSAIFLNSFLRRKFSSVTIVRFAPVLLCVVYACLSLGRNPWQLAIVFFCLGILFQPLDVNVNILGSAYEKATGKHILARMHGFFSLGATSGALLSSICATSHLAYRQQFMCVAIIAICIAIYAGINLRLLDATQNQVHQKDKIGFSGKILVLAVLGFCAMFIEGTTIDWSSLFLSEAKHIPAQFAGYGFTLFNLAITCGRFWGDFVRAKLGIVHTAITAACITVMALLCILFFPSYFSMTAYLLLGLGLCVFVPLLIGSSSLLFPQAPHAAVTIVSVVAIGAMLCGPPFMGTITHTFGMARGMWLQAFLSWIILLILPAFVSAIKNAHSQNAPSPDEIADLLEKPWNSNRS